MQELRVRGSANTQQVDDENQRLAAADDRWRTTIAVAKVCWYFESTLAANFHALHALVPALDYMSSAKWEPKGLTPVPTCIELFTG